MSILEIVLTSVLSVVVFASVFYIIILKTNNENRRETFDIINEEAVPESIVFFGDSLTDFFPIQDFFPALPIYNRGIAGNTTKDLLKRLANVVALEPAKLFLQIGTNDLGKGVKPFKIVDNIRLICEDFQQKAPATRLFLISLYPVSHTRTWLSFIISGRRKNKKIKEVNALLENLSTTLDITYINMFDALLNGGKRLYPLYTIEGLHISGAGYRVITNVLNPYVLGD